MVAEFDGKSRKGEAPAASKAKGPNLLKPCSAESLTKDREIGEEAGADGM